MKAVSNARARLLSDLARDPGILILAYPYARTWTEISREVISRSWNQIPPETPAAVYVHIPFCRRKCKFCDFLAYYGRPQGEIEQYMTLLHKELRLVANSTGQVKIETVHLGGGTPSLLSPDQIASFLEAISSSLHLCSNPQITMEVFPDSFVTKEQLTGWKRAGVNRLSFGFQFFDDALKMALNRTDFAEDNLRLMNEAKEAGFHDINIDLMCGLPEQSIQSWLDTLEKTVSLDPTHICVFPVSVRHPGIPLFKTQAALPTPDKTRRMYDEAFRYLREVGYQRTTRHNFVRSGYEYPYEKMIAELSPLVGLGANSISYAKDCIYRNYSDLAQYASAITRKEIPSRAGHFFDEKERLNNFAVRQIEYLRLNGAEFEHQFGQSLSTVFKEEITLLEEFGLGHMAGADLLLTDDGVYYTSAVKRTLFHESAWDRLKEMSSDEFKIERGNLVLSGVG